MRTAISFGGAGGAGEDWSDLVEYVREAERLGWISRGRRKRGARTQ